MKYSDGGVKSHTRGPESYNSHQLLMVETYRK